MRLLICTQIVDENDQNLGFFHQWIEEMSRYCSEILVICLKEGTHHLPAHVRVVSLGKEHGRSRLTYLWRLYRTSVRERNRYDAVFVHMNVEYVLLVGILWRLWGKRVALWYMHRAISVRLRVALILVHRVFTASTASFRLASPKVLVLGHGIDTHAFACPLRSQTDTSTALRLITVGRVSEAKNTEFMIEVARVLYAEGVIQSFTIVGEGITPNDFAYAQRLRDDVTHRGEQEVIRFVGPRAHGTITPLLCAADIFFNASTTGSLDKAVLEAMSAGVIPVTTNEAFRGLLPHALCPQNDAQACVGAIRAANQNATAADMRTVVERNHALPTLISRIIADYTVYTP